MEILIDRVFKDPVALTMRCEYEMERKRERECEGCFC